MATKSDLIDQIQKTVEGLDRKAATEAVDAVFESISKSLQEGERVQVAGFGTFAISERMERQGRNPQTGASITIPASTGVRFKAGKRLKAAVGTGSTGPRRK